MRAEAEWWLRAAEENLRDAEVLMAGGRYAAFCAHQAAEKALRAAVIELRRKLPPGTHNLLVLARELGVEDEEMLERLRLLNPHYVVSRYPDAANAVPGDVYSRRLAGELVGAARAVVGWVRESLRRCPRPARTR